MALINNDHIPKRLRQFVNRLVSELGLDRGYKCTTKAAIAARAIQCLVLTGPIGKCVADSRCTSNPGTRLRVTIWDALIAAGLATYCRGSEKSGKVTRYRATSRLLDLFKGWKLPQLAGLNLARNTQRDNNPTLHALVAVRGEKDAVTGKRPIVSFQSYDPATRQRLARIEDRIEAVNQENLRHQWAAIGNDPDTGKSRVYQPNVVVHQLHSGRLGRVARLYTFGPRSAQRIPKKLRLRMRIDCEPVVAIDIQGSLPRLALNLSGIDPSHTTDIYRPKRVLPKFWSSQMADRKSQGIVRNFIKRATVICMNTRTEAQALGAFRQLLTSRSKTLRRALFEIEGLRSWRHFMKRIKKAQPELNANGYFFQDRGAHLMTVEGKIMLRIVERLTKTKRPVLGIHDCVLCRKSDLAFAERTVRRVYRSVAGFDPVLVRE